MKDDISRFIGMVLDNKYEIKQLLGKGGTGNVFKGTHLYMQIPVAVKLLHPHLITDETAVKRFHQEAKLAISIKHDNAVSIMDFGMVNNELLYLVMEFIDGISLAYLLKQEKGMDINRVVKFMKQICQAVDVAHKKDIIHRDLKPGNIMIVDCDQPNEMAKVIDFSIAKLSSGKGQDLTGQGIVIGTPEYVSPEQVEGSSLDNRSDIYSLGVVLYQMLAGELPFQGKSAMTLFMKHIHTIPPPLTNIRPEIPARLEAVVMKALSKKAAQRQNTVLELAAELEAAITDFSSEGNSFSRMRMDIDAKETDIPTVMVDSGQSKKDKVNPNITGEEPKRNITIEKPRHSPEAFFPSDDMTQELETPREIRQKNKEPLNLPIEPVQQITKQSSKNLLAETSNQKEQPKSFWQKILNLFSGLWQKK
ncbi:MAG: serine/threonine protein kinase bacterial [bacterium]|nr:MAG: serine/threonine protein kinase bacterial [bacterium]